MGFGRTRFRARHFTTCLDQADAKGRVGAQAVLDHVHVARLEDAQRQPPQISQILHGEVNTRRSHWLEIIIIILITIEVVPFLYGLLK